MHSPGVGDMAQGYVLRRQNAALKTELGALATELASGKARDLPAHLGGDFTALAGIERDLSVQTAKVSAIDEVAGFVSAQQMALATVQDRAGDVGFKFIEAATQGDSTMMRVTLADADSAFRSVVGALNTRFADRTLFAGAATQSPALADPETLLADLGAALAAETTASGAMAAATAWFETPGVGFDLTGYTGSDTPLSAMPLAGDAPAPVDTTAQTPAVRDSLKAFALSALAADGFLATDPGEQRKLLEAVGKDMLGAQDALVDLRAGIGSTEGRVEAARARADAEISALRLARDALIGIDPYETATQLETVQTQLETVYTLTARMSRMTLASVLR